MDTYTNDRLARFVSANYKERIAIVKGTHFDELTYDERTFYFRHIPLTEMSSEGMRGWAARQVAKWPYELTKQERTDIMRELIESNKMMAIKCQQTETRLAHLEEARRQRKEAEERRREELQKERARVTTITISEDELKSFYDL